MYNSAPSFFICANKKTIFWRERSARYMAKQLNVNLQMTADTSQASQQ